MPAPASRPVGTGGNVRVAGSYARPVGSSVGRAVAAPLMKQRPTCAAVKSDGTRCGALPIKGVGICIGHKRQEEAARANSE